MKKIIRKLADMYGVTTDIQRETRLEVGHDLNDQKYWWSKQPMLINAFHLVAKAYLSGMYRADISTVREDVYKQGNKRFDNL